MGEAWLFSGQGSQYAGMLERLQARTETAPVDGVLRAAERYCSSQLLSDATKGPWPTLAQPKNAEVGITIYGLARAKSLRAERGSPDFVFGYSAGETAALFVAGVLDQAAALEASSIRGQVLQKYVCPATRMLAVAGVPIACVEQALDGIDERELAISGYNTSDHCTVVGRGDKLVSFARSMRGRGGVISDVDALGPWHTSRASLAAEELLGRFMHLNFERPQRQLLMSASGRFEDDPERIRTLYAYQIAHPVRFSSALERLRDVRPTAVLDAGPGKTLYSFALRESRAAKLGWNVCAAERLEARRVSAAQASRMSVSTVATAGPSLVQDEFQRQLEL